MKDKKVNHKAGYHKRTKNPTANYPKDSHKEFCRRCISYNTVCPITGGNPTKSCEL